MAGVHGCAKPTEAFEPSAWLTIRNDNTILLLLSKSEMGQGVTTVLPSLVAEELEAPLDLFEVGFAPSNPRYYYPGLTRMSTGGSASMEESWLFLRQMGAIARTMLVTSAARNWNVDEASCSTANGKVTHRASGREATYGSLVAAASALPVPRSIALKKPAEHKLIGKAIDRLDIPAITDGSAKYGIDVVVPGMKYAAIARPERFGAKLIRFDDRRARAVPGVVDVVETPHGVAVVASNTWAAMRGKRELEIEWSSGDPRALDSPAMVRDATRVLRDPSKVTRVRNRGTVPHEPAQTIEATYVAPFVAHATMEPMNATADVRSDSCEIWAPTQAPTRSQLAAARVTGLPVEKCIVHPTRIGGGFGRRLLADYVEEAAALSQRIGAPVKVTWTREDDIAHDYYRPMSVNIIKGMLDEHGALIGLSHSVASESIIRTLDIEDFRRARYIDEASLDGLVSDFVYDVPYYAVGYADVEYGVPVGPWRAPNANWNEFVVESFIDELAHQANRDPIEFRLALLHRAPRITSALRAAASIVEWSDRARDKRNLGIALTVWSSIGVIVAEVATSANGTIGVRHVTAVMDCGTVVNPNVVKSQVTGAIYQGLSAAMYERITIAQGRPQQQNFDSYRLMRLAEAPTVDVHFVPSTRPPTGIGETAIPGIAPAVGNAIFAATGRRIRELPFTRG